VLFCNNCGQCIYISNAQFRGDQTGTAYQVVYFNPETGEEEDYGDSDSDNWETSGDTFCPHCEYTDIDWDWDGTEEEAFKKRAEYEKGIKQKRELAKIKESGWDI